MQTALRDRRGFTLIEIVIAVAIVAIFAAAISPMVFRHLEDAKIGKAQNEAETIATAVLNYYKDVGAWPYTNTNGPAGNQIDRVLSSSVVATGTGPDAAPGAGNWGTYGNSKSLGDYLYFNNPDDDSSASGNGADQNNQDWPTTGKGAWKGPYLDGYDIRDPWGNPYEYRQLDRRTYQIQCYGEDCQPDTEDDASRCWTAAQWAERPHDRGTVVSFRIFRISARESSRASMTRWKPHASRNRTRSGSRLSAWVLAKRGMGGRSISKSPISWMIRASTPAW